MNHLANTITKLAQDYCLIILVRMCIISHVCYTCAYIKTYDSEWLGQEEAVSYLQVKNSPAL